MKVVVQLVLATACIANVPSIHAQSNAFSDGDKTFLKDSAQDGMAEVKLAQLALRTSKDPTVMTFAKKMIEDHQKMMNEAKPVAMKAGITPSDSMSMEADAEYLKLKALNGATFDKSYMQAMVSDHHKDLEAAKDEHEKTQNEDMRRLSARAQELIASHTEMADRIAAKMGV